MWLLLIVIFPSTNYLPHIYCNTPDFIFSKYFKSRKSWYFFYPAGFQTPLTCAGTQWVQRVHLRVWGLWVISWGCCSVPEGSPEHRWGWHSAGSSLSGPRFPSSSGSLPLSAAASPAEKTSHSLCRGVPLGGYYSVLQDTKDSIIERHKRQQYRKCFKFQTGHIWTLQYLTLLQDNYAQIGEFFFSLKNETLYLDVMIGVWKFWIPWLILPCFKLFVAFVKLVSRKAPKQVKLSEKPKWNYNFIELILMFSSFSLLCQFVNLNAVVSVVMQKSNNHV